MKAQSKQSVKRAQISKLHLSFLVTKREAIKTAKLGQNKDSFIPGTFLQQWPEGNAIKASQ